jgi:OFA family oxalate/formate antiporter-like MFS transporter
MFFILYAVGFGVGKGFIYPAPLRATWSHLPGRKGLVSGVITAGLGFGAFIYGLIINFIVNPNNIKPIKTEVRPGVYEYVFSKEVSNNVPKML